MRFLSHHRSVGPNRPHFVIAMHLLACIFWLPAAATARDGFRLSGGLKVVSVSPGKQATPEAPGLARGAESSTVVSLLANVPPLDGPQTLVVMTATDARLAGDTEPYAFPSVGVTGSPLPGATANQVLAVFDTGGGAHLVSYPDAVALGLQGAYLLDDVVTVQGVIGQIDMVMSVPAGFFVHGIQDLNAGGQLVPSLAFGQWNFVGLANTLENYLAGDTVPTILGTPFFADFCAYVQHSQRIDTNVGGQAVSSAAVTIYPTPTDPDLPVLDKRILLEVPDGGSELLVAYLGLPEVFMLAPSQVAGDPPLFFTANNVTLGEGANSASMSMAVDTGAQATLINLAAANALGLNLQQPDFQVEVQGIGSATLTAPGFYVDEFSIPVRINQSGVSTNEVWNNVPIVVINVLSIDGIFGMNLLANRDYVFNGALPTGPFDNPYLDITDPFIEPEIQIIDIRLTDPDTVEVDWLSQPAAPLLHLQSTTNPAGSSVTWTTVATGDLPTSTGTMTVTGVQDHAYFRLYAP